MIKKIWLLLISLFVIFWFWVSFANPVYVDRYYVCSMFENVEIDNYRVVVQNGSGFYEFVKGDCSQCWEDSVDDGHTWLRHRRFGLSQKVFLLDKSINIEDITVDNVENNAILIWFIRSPFCDESEYNENETVNIIKITDVYKVIKEWNSYVMLDITEHYEVIQEIKDKLKDFPISWLFTVIVETLVLLFIAKLFRKEEKMGGETWYEENEISNKKLLLWWIIPTTITLPLLWFALPLLIGRYRYTIIWYTMIWELFVTIIEAVILKYWLKISRRKAILVSIICNAASYLAWLLIF